MEHNWFESDPPEAAPYLTGLTSPWEWEEDFMKALKTNKQQILHRSFKRWKNEIHDEWKESQRRSYDSPSIKYGLLALNNPSYASVKSTADLDAEGSRLLDFVLPIARSWRVSVFLGKTNATWYGPRDSTPNRIPEVDRRDHHLISRYYDEPDSGDPPEFVPNAFRRLSEMGGTDYDQGITEMYDLDGGVVLPLDEIMLISKDPLPWDKYWAKHSRPTNIQYDFFPLAPNREKLNKPEEYYGPTVEQTWIKNVIILVPPTVVWPMYKEAHAKYMYTGFNILRGFTRSLIDQFLETNSNCSQDITFCNAKNAVSSVFSDEDSTDDSETGALGLASYRRRGTLGARISTTPNNLQAIDGTLRARILQFALQQKDLHLFKKACCSPHNRRTGKTWEDEPPSTSFFAWLRRYFTRKDAIGFTAIQEELTTLIGAYNGLSTRFEALDNLLNHEMPYSEQTRAQRKWAQEVAVYFVNGAPQLDSFLNATRDGQAVIDMALFYAAPGFLTRFIQHYVYERSNPNLKTPPQNLMWLWIVGFLNRLLERADPEHLSGREPKEVYREIFNRVIVPIDIWKSLDIMNPDDCYPGTGRREGITPPDILRMMRDLSDLGLNDEFKKLYKSIIQRTRDRGAIHGSNSRRDLEYRPPASIREFSHIWLPLLRKLASSNLFNLSQPACRDKCGLLFRQILISYAIIIVGKQPLHKPDDLRRVPFKQPRKPWDDAYTELHNFLIDPTRKEARFSNYNANDRAHARSSVEFLDFRTYCDMKTKPSTFVMVKLSRTDPKQHQAWRERKLKFRAEIQEKFDQTFLKFLIGNDKYDEIMEMASLDRREPSPDPAPASAPGPVPQQPVTVAPNQPPRLMISTRRKRPASQISTAPDA
ncbi:hypothetical protein V8F06_009009 [Rhypophila decipiens]